MQWSSVRLYSVFEAAYHQWTYNSCDDLVVRVCLLFNSMIKQSFLSHLTSDLGLLNRCWRIHMATLVELTWHRPITLTPVMSKLFESVLLQLYSDYLTSDNTTYSLGLRRALTHCLHLPNLWHILVNNGSKVHCSFTDASKTFDNNNNNNVNATVWSR